MTSEKPIIVIKFLRGEGRKVVLAPLSVLREPGSYQPTVVDVLPEPEDDYNDENLGWGQSSQTDEFGRVGRSSSCASLLPLPGLEPVAGPLFHQLAPEASGHEFVRPIGSSEAEAGRKERNKSGRNRNRDQKRRRQHMTSDTSGNRKNVRKK